VEGGSSQRLNINAGTSDALKNLNDDWVITSITESRIELADDSNNNDVLHFVR
jgi:hypothetical protein